MCAAFLSRPAASPTRFGKRRPMTSTGSSGTRGNREARRRRASRRHRGRRTPRRAPSPDRARTAADERADTASERLEAGAMITSRRMLARTLHRCRFAVSPFCSVARSPLGASFPRASPSPPRASRRAKRRVEPRSSYAERDDVRAFIAEMSDAARLRRARARALARVRALPAEDRRADEPADPRAAEVVRVRAAVPRAGARGRGRRVLERACADRSRAPKARPACPPKSSSRSSASRPTTAATPAAIASSMRLPRSRSTIRAARRSSAAS